MPGRDRTRTFFFRIQVCHVRHPGASLSLSEGVAYRVQLHGMLSPMGADVVRNTIAEIHDRGYAVLRNHFPIHFVDACRSVFWSQLPPHAIVVSFGLLRIAQENGPIEIAPGTHRMTRIEANQAVERGDITLETVPLEIGDVVIRHPWALHRATPNTTDTPRPLVSIRYVRRWYADDSGDVSPIPRPLWEAVTPDQRQVLRFPAGA